MADRLGRKHDARPRVFSGDAILILRLHYEPPALEMYYLAPICPQNRTGIEVINRKSGTCPVMPNWAVTLSRVRVQTIVLKSTSTVLNTRSEFGTTKSVKCGLVR